MIEIIGNKNNKIYYKCDCGAEGFYIFKPLKRNAIFVIDVTCPLCLDITRLTILQHDSENGISKDLNEIELEWSPVIDNDFI